MNKDRIIDVAGWAIVVSMGAAMLLCVVLAVWGLMQ
jgi:hypothetical protein